jgi:subtilisin family serine protease
MNAKKNISQFDSKSVIEPLFCILFFLISTAFILPSTSQSSQFYPDLGSSLAQNCNLCSSEPKELMIMSLRGEQYTNQVKEIQNILNDSGFSLKEVEDWQEECTQGRCIETILVPGVKPKDPAAGSDQDLVWISIFPNKTSLDWYYENAKPDNSMLEGWGYFKGELIDLGGGLKAVAAASRWSVYNEVELPPDNLPYPTGEANVIFRCGNLLVSLRHMKVAAYSWRDFPGSTDDAQDTMGNESLQPVKDLAAKIAFALSAKKLCQLKPNVIIKVRAAGYTSAEKELEDLQGLKEIKISGKVTDNMTGKPVEGAKVEVVLGANNTSTITSADGNYSIAAIEPGGEGSKTKEKIDFELKPLQYIVGVTDITPEVIDLIKKNNGTVVDQVKYEKGPRALLVNLNDEKYKYSFVSNVNSSPLVKYVEPNGLIRASHVPNDPRYPAQWGPRNIHAGGLPNPSAWDVENGDKNVTIAIIDTGIQYDHEDLYKFRDGGTKYKYGYDWVDGDEDPSPQGFEGHGTHCAGIAIAVMDNSKGIAGIAPNCTFIAERTLNYWGRGTNWDTSRGIMDAAEHEADIISMSLGSNVSSELMRDATLYASSLGSILVAAAGNDADKIWYSEGINYPAAYLWVIAVGAVNPQDLRADFSQWGREMALVAPGVDIVSTIPWNDYANMSGTSMATPHVAGVAALVKSRAERWPAESYATNPRYHLNNDQITKVLIQSAVDLGPTGWDQEYGYGKVDAGRAVRCVNISGNVLEAVLNAPIGGVEVRATSIQGPPGVYSTRENSSLARMSSDGEYFIRVPPGIYHICAMAHGYIPSCGMDGDRVELPAFDINGNLYKDNRDFRLVPFGFNLTGRVLDGSTGQPVSEAGIFLEGPPSMLPPHSPVAYQTETNSSGYYWILLEFGVDPYGPYNIRAMKQGYIDQNKSFDLDWDKTVTNYYTCRNCGLDARDYNPISVNFTLAVGQSSASLGGMPRKAENSNGSTSRRAMEEGDTDKNIAALKDPNSTTRLNAAVALGHINDSRAVEPLIKALKDNESVVRMSAAGALGRLKDIRAVEPLIQALKDNSSMVRAYAAGALGKIGDTRAIDTLNHAITDSSPYVREVAKEALTSFNISSKEEDVLVLDHSMASQVDEKTGQLIARASVFYSGTSKAYSWLRLGGVKDGLTVEWIWLSPDGALYHSETYQIPALGKASGGVDVYSFIPIAGSDAAKMQGNWRVDVFIDGKMILTEQFVLLLQGQSQPSGKATGSKKEGDLQDGCHIDPATGQVICVDTIGDFANPSGSIREGANNLQPETAFSIPQSMQECETYTSEICGTWTLEDGYFNAVWDNGAKATVNVEQFDDNAVVFTRQDAQGSSAGLTARYEGRRSGNHAEGSVTWDWQGSRWSGTWEGRLVNGRAA